MPRKGSDETRQITKGPLGDNKSTGIGGGKARRTTLPGFRKPRDEQTTNVDKSSYTRNTKPGR